MAPGDIEILVFVLEVRFKLDETVFSVTGSISHGANYVIEDAFVFRKKHVIELKPVLALSSNQWDFGTVDQGDSPEMSFDVFDDAGGKRISLKWEVTDWPDWVDLVRSISDGLAISVSDSATAGRHSGTIVVESNGGTQTIDISVNVVPIPTATRTKTPTATPAPITPTPGVATPTLSKPTSRPTPTITSMPQTPIPTTESATPTPQPTSTSSPVTPTDTPAARKLTATSTPTPRPIDGVKIAKVRNPAGGQPVAPSEPSTGSCSANFGPSSAATGMANLLFWFGPVGVIVGFRHRRRIGLRSSVGSIFQSARLHCKIRLSK